MVTATGRRGGSPPRAAAGRPAARAEPAGPRAPRSSTPAAAPARCCRRPRRPAPPLPQRVVGVLHRQRRQSSAYALRPRAVQRRQVARQRTERPAVARDVVQHDQQHVLGSSAHQLEQCARSGISRARSKARPAAAVSAAAGSASSSTEPISSRGRADAAQDLLPRPPSRSGTPCAGSRGARPDRRAPPPAPPRRAAPSSRTPAGSRRCRWPLQPLEEPQPLLREGQRDLGRPRLHRHERRPRPPAPPTTAAAPAPPTLGASNSLRIGSSTSKRRADPADQTRRQQRVAAEVEEVVVDADPLDAEHLGEQRAQDRLLRRPRRPMRRRAPSSGAGSARRSSLPFGVSGSAPAPRAPTAPCSPAAAATAQPAAPRCPAPRPLPPPRRRPAAGRPAPSGRAITAACDTPGCAVSAASISPGSMRKPRIFTCWSTRPRNSSAPSGRQRARSPVRYSRRARPRRTGRRRTAPPSAPAGSDSRAPAQRPRCTARPTRPTGTGSSPPSST